MGGWRSRGRAGAVMCFPATSPARLPSAPRLGQEARRKGGGVERDAQGQAVGVFVARQACTPAAQSLGCWDLADQSAHRSLYSGRSAHAAPTAASSPANVAKFNLPWCDCVSQMMLMSGRPPACGRGATGRAAGLALAHGCARTTQALGGWLACCSHLPWPGKPCLRLHLYPAARPLPCHLPRAGCGC